MRSPGASRTWGIVATLPIAGAAVLALVATTGLVPYGIDPLSGEAGAVTTHLYAPEAPMYPVIFVESGLPPNTLWSVSFNNSSQSSTANAIQFHSSNGFFPFTIGMVTGYNATPASGNLTVSGGPVFQSISFSVAHYVVSFDETGLPANASWSVTLNGTTVSSNLTSIQFIEPNGQYNFSVGGVPGFGATPAAGGITVSGGPASQPVSFSATSSGSATTFLGLTDLELLAILAAAAVVALLLLGGIFDCPDACNPEGKKIDCGPHVYIDTVPCGTAPDWINDIETGAEIIALGSKVAEKIEIVGEAYAKVLESVPGWIPVIKKLTEQKVGFEAYARVVCSWNTCQSVWCLWPPWKWHLDWVREGRFYGPYQLTPPAGYQGGSGGTCFKPGMETNQIYEGLQKAVDDNEKVQAAKRKCNEDCSTQ